MEVEEVVSVEVSSAVMEVEVMVVMEAMVQLWELQPREVNIHPPTGYMTTSLKMFQKAGKINLENAMIQ